MQKAPPTPKGFRDIEPELAKKRREVINSIVDVLEEAGFQPIETPTIEFAQTLEGKYGEEEKLIYEFQDRGGRDLALRYDLTVPLARYVATYQPKLPFRRWQIGQVFRGENPQHGRYREFTQLDFDSVGSDSFEEDALIIASAIKSVRKLGLAKAQMAINDRKIFAHVPQKVVRAFDKLHKIGKVGIEKELVSQGLTQAEIHKYVDMIEKAQPTSDLKKLSDYLSSHGLTVQDDFGIDPTLARGLDYYTGSIFELKPNNDPASLSIGAGGRYDNLIGMFVYPDKGRVKKPVPAVGFSFGLDRLIEALQALQALQG